MFKYMFKYKTVHKCVKCKCFFDEEDLQKVEIIDEDDRRKIYYCPKHQKDYDRIFKTPFGKDYYMKAIDDFGNEYYIKQID